MIDRTQSIDTLATGMDSNMSPRRRLVSINTENVQDSSAIFTMYTRDKSIDKFTANNTTTFNRQGGLLLNSEELV
jgi:hypothetical protein